MEHDSLNAFIEKIRRVWGRLDSELVAKSQALMEELSSAPATERWLADLQDKEVNRELYRDADYGFVLLAHTESEGLYRVPHDHGNGWVIYVVQRGEMEMGTYGRIPDEQGGYEIVRRERYRMSQGQSRVYLPGDIHDTRCVSKNVLMLRLTSCDLAAEKASGRLHQYARTR